DAVPASVSFFGDSQESPAVVLPELHVEMLTFDLQFSRLDNVIHFYLRLPTVSHSIWPMEEKSALGIQIFWAAPFPPSSGTSALRSGRDLGRLTATESRTLPRFGGTSDAHRLRCCPLNLQSPARVRPNALKHARANRFQFLSITAKPTPSRSLADRR